MTGFYHIRLDLLEKFIEHEFVDLTGAGSVKLYYRFIFRPIAVQSTKLATGIAEKNEKMFGLAAVDFVQYLLFGISIDYPGKYTVFNSIQNDPTIGFGCWLFVELRTCIFVIETAIKSSIQIIITSIIETANCHTHKWVVHFWKQFFWIRPRGITTLG